LCGIPVRFLDTAGICRGQGVVESLGIERSYQAVAGADFSLVVLDGSGPLQENGEKNLARTRKQGKFLVVANKSDLPLLIDIPDALTVSARTGAGIAALRGSIISSITPDGRLEQEGGFITNLRHEQLLNESQQALMQARLAAERGIPH